MKAKSWDKLSNNKIKNMMRKKGNKKRKKKKRRVL